MERELQYVQTCLEVRSTAEEKLTRHPTFRPKFRVPVSYALPEREDSGTPIIEYISARGCADRRSWTPVR